jgi:hypothetical protein
MIKNGGLSQKIVCLSHANFSHTNLMTIHAEWYKKYLKNVLWWVASFSGCSGIKNGARREKVNEKTKSNQWSKTDNVINGPKEETFMYNIYSSMSGERGCRYKVTKIQKSDRAKQKRIKDGKSTWVRVLTSNTAYNRSYLNFNTHQASQWRCSSSPTRMTRISTDMILMALDKLINSNKRSTDSSGYASK